MLDADELAEEAQELAANKRRRGLGVVTPNACTECRKKRAKVRCAIYVFDCFHTHSCHGLNFSMRRIFAGDLENCSDHTCSAMAAGPADDAER